MNNTLYYLSRGLSAVLYPMFIPTYGMLIYFLSLREFISYPAPLIWIGVLGTLVFTCLLPLSVILVMIHRGNLTDIYIRNPKQRTMPYIYSTICYGFWAYFCSQVMHLPQFIVLTAIGSTVVLLLILLHVEDQRPSGSVGRSVRSNDEFQPEYRSKCYTCTCRLLDSSHTADVCPRI